MSIDTALRLAFAVVFCLICTGLILLGEWLKENMYEKHYPQLDE